MNHATITIEEVENGLLVNIVDDKTRTTKKARKQSFNESLDMNDLMESIKPAIYIAVTIEEACNRITEYFNHREKV